VNTKSEDFFSTVFTAAESHCPSHFRGHNVLTAVLTHCVTTEKEHESMSALTTLKLTNVRKPTQQPVIVNQRNKLAKRLWEQMELAKAQATGDTFASKRLKSVVDADGIRRTVEVAKRVKPWWFVSESGKVCVNVRYGSQVIELAKGKSAVEVASPSELLSTLELIKTAVINGELDSQIQAASGHLRAGFKR
jgi:hypothetical protein